MTKLLTLRDVSLAALLASSIGLIVGWYIHGQVPSDEPAPGSGRNGGASAVEGVQGSSSLTINGDTEGLLVPGSTLPIDVSLNNPNDFDYTVHHLSMSVTAVHAP